MMQNAVVWRRQILLGALLIATLSACQNDEAAIAGAEAPDARSSDTIVIRELDADGVGSYLVAATAGVEGDDGYTLKLEERFYPEVRMSRFLVEQAGLEHRIRTGNIDSLDLKITRNGRELVTTSLMDELAGKLDGLTYASELMPSDLSSRSATDRSCAVLSVQYSDASLYPHVLNTCDTRNIALSSK